jgi:phospholipid/cholesterol/gamma-HCH transport system substrate-binding protein
VNRSLIVRMVALVAVLLASFYYIAFDVAGWRLGAQDFRVTVMMPQAGGIYTEADVTYRGVTVGRVVKLDLKPTGVAVVAEIVPGTKIPSHSVASVRELSAAGEQYLDFVPTTPGGPYLHPGSVVPASQTTIPVAIDKVLADTSSLLDSINPQQLTTVTNAFGTGFGGTGTDLRNIVVAGQALFKALQAASTSTIEVVVGGNTVLKGAVATDKAFGRFAAGLDKVSAQFKASNSDITSLLGNGVASEQQTSLLLDQSSGSLASLFDNAGTVSGVQLAERSEVQALFQVLPVFAGRIGTIVHGGSLHVELDYNTDDPVCPYISGAQTPLPTQKIAGPDLNRYCGLSTPGALVRGAG